MLKVLFLENNWCYFIIIWVVNSVGFFIIKLFLFLFFDFEVFKDGIVLDGWGLIDV